MRTHRRALLPMLFLAVASCLPSREVPATVVMTLTYDEALALTALEIVVQSADRTADLANLQAKVLPEVPVTLAQWGGGEVVIDVWGLKGETRLVHGEMIAAPIKGMAIQVAVSLTEVLCRDACAIGERRCAVDGPHAVIECARASGGCTVWGPPRSCPAEAPVCAAGLCEVGCPAECPVKAPECLAGTTLRTYEPGVCEGGTCSYPFLDTDCAPDVCVSGACQPAPQPDWNGCFEVWDHLTCNDLCPAIGLGCTPACEGSLAYAIYTLWGPCDAGQQTKYFGSSCGDVLDIGTSGALYVVCCCQ